MRKSYWILLIFLLPPFEAIAQTGTCEPALAEAYLDAGNVRARILNNGGLFWRGSPHVYEIDGANAIYNANIWVGGLIDDELRIAATRYGDWEFWAGPIQDTDQQTTDCKQYDKIWEIRTEDIVAYQENNEVSANLKNWPAHLGAPVIDGDGNPDNYNIEKGDLPALLGDQRLWWIMNDRGNTHTSTGSDPIGLEVHGSAHAFTHPGFVGNVTFYNYKLINKNQADFKDVFFGIFKDVDLGNFDDDYVGSDSLLHLSFAYNADNDDEGGYGKAPPAIGFTFLESILAPSDDVDNDRDGIVDELGEMLGAYGMMFYQKGGYRGAHVGMDYYLYMKSRWKQDVPLYRGLLGDSWLGVEDFSHLPLETTRFFYSGDPTSGAFWSELNYDNRGNPYYPADRRSIVSTGPFAIPPNDTVEVRFAIVWSRGKDNLDSVRQLKKESLSIRQGGDVFYTPLLTITGKQEEILISNNVLGFDQNFPNPFTQLTTLRYSLPQTMQVRLAVYDMLGREVALLVDAQQEAGIHTTDFDAGDLPAGIYLARIELDFLRFTKRMVLLR